MNRNLQILAVVLLTVAPGLAQAVGYTHTRDGWAYGLNAGWGWAQGKVTDTDTDSILETEWNDDLTGALRVAFAPDDTWTYGLDISGWTQKEQGVDQTVFSFLVDLHYYPQGQGFFVHGGVGMGSVNLAYTAPASTTSQAGSGWAWGAGLGYEVRVSPTFALGLAYDYRRVSVGEISYFDDVSALVQSATVALTWYGE